MVYHAPQKGGSNPPKRGILLKEIKVKIILLLNDF